MSGSNLQVSEEYFIIDKQQVFCRISGTGSAVILLHGFPSSSFVWRKTIPYLAGIRKVIVPDMLGYGRSDKPLHVEYTIDYQTNILNELIDQLGLREVELVVHDLGGPVGMLWAIDNPNRVRKLVILNSLASAEINFRDRLTVGLMGLPGSGKIFATRPMLKYILESHVYNKKIMNKELLEAYMLPYSNISDLKVMIKTFIGSLNNKGRSILGRIVAELPKLDVPIILIRGQNDPHCGKYMQRLEKMLPEATCKTLSSCGHFIQEDQPKLLNHLLLECLSN